MDNLGLIMWSSKSAAIAAAGAKMLEFCRFEIADGL
jgi:hypothetical protein